MQLQQASAMGCLRWRRLLENMLMATLLAITLIIPTANSYPPEALRVQLRWLPQAQFAGFYVARDNEIFRKNGLDVTIEPGGPTVNGLQRLLDGEVDVAVAWSSDALDLRRQGGDVVNIGQLLQQPGTMLVCNSTSGVARAEDLIGKRVGTWKIGDQFDVGHWLKSHGLGLHDIELIQQRPAAQDLLSGDVDCATAMSYNEFQTILNAGELKTGLFTVRFAQESSGFLEDGLYMFGSP